MSSNNERKRGNSRSDNQFKNNRKQHRNGTSIKDEKLSRVLSWALRHQGPNIGLSMTPDGYVPVVQILECPHKKLSSSPPWTVQDIQHAVQISDKQRFQLDWRPAKNYPMVALLAPDAADGSAVGNKDSLLCIRATQGHSLKFIDSDLLLAVIPKDELAQIPTIVHGTSHQPWQTICRQGLNRMNRNHIHFAAGLPHEKGTVISGMRKTCDVYIYVDGQKCANDYPAITFYRSTNGVLLTAGVDEQGNLPIEYFSHVTDPEGRILLDNRTTTSPTATTTTVVSTDETKRDKEES